MKKMKVKAPAYRVLVKLQPTDSEKEEKSQSGLILKIKTDRDLELEQLGACIAQVLDIGCCAFQNKGNNPTPWFKVGDYVQLYKHSGDVVSGIKDGFVYKLINDLDVVAVFSEDEGIDLGVEI